MDLAYQLPEPEVLHLGIHRPERPDHRSIHHTVFGIVVEFPVFGTVDGRAEVAVGIERSPACMHYLDARS